MTRDLTSPPRAGAQEGLLAVRDGIHRLHQPSPGKLAARDDLYRIPLFVGTKLAYAVAPISVLFRVANAIGAVDSLCSPRRAEVVECLKRHLGPTKSEEELRLIVRRHFEFNRRGPLARLWPQIRNFTEAEAIEVEGLQHLDAAAAAGRGVIIVSSHFGYARLIKPILRFHKRQAVLVGDIGARDFPHRFTGVGRFVHSHLLRLPQWSRYDDRWRQTVGGDLAAQFNLRPHLAALERNEVLILLGDGSRAQARSGASVLDVNVRLAPGAMSIARSTGAPVLPAFVVDDLRRKDPIGLRMVIHPPLSLQVTSNARGDLEVNLRRFAGVLEQAVRTHPHNFHWMWVREGVLELGFAW